MTQEQFTQLLAAIKGEHTALTPAFIIDSPWLPNWANMTIMDYFSSEEKWYQAHLKAAKTFPDAIFIPGFWSEFGMCTEPSAFGARCVFPEDEFPHAHKVIETSADISRLAKPRPDRDGLLPFMIKRLEHLRTAMEKEGHHILFSVSRGPLNIASYLMGTTEFLMTLMSEPVKAHQLIRLITDFLHEWHDHQVKCFDSIQGIMLLDDIIGFMSGEQFREFGLPYFTELFDRKMPVRLLHNDAPCRESAPMLNEMGVNLFNMGVDISLTDLAEQTGNRVCLMGNLPPRDVLASASAEAIRKSTQDMLGQTSRTMKLLPSCGGGMPPGVSSENILTFMETVKQHNYGEIQRNH